MCPTLPDHFFIADNGDLIDTRVPEWHKKVPLRPVYSYVRAIIHNNHELKAALRAGPYVWPGGYKIFFIAGNDMAMSFEGVYKDFIQSRGDIETFKFPFHPEINWEDEHLICEITGEPIPPEYGDD